MTDERNLPLLVFKDHPEKDLYTSKRGRGPEKTIFQRDRQQHASVLKNQFQGIRDQAEKLEEARKRFGIDEKQGVRVTVTGNIGYDFMADQLENRNRKFELLIEKNNDGENTENPPSATFLIPHGKLESFTKMLTKYANSKENQSHSHHDLFNSIEEIKQTSFLDLWTSDVTQLPDLDEEKFWEIWVRSGRSNAGQKKVIDKFISQCQLLDIYASKNTLSFAERTVFLVRTTREKLSSTVELLDLIAEIRKPADTVELITSSSPTEQSMWVDDLASRVVEPSPNSPAVCILDTGLNYAHKLLKAGTKEEYCNAYNPKWGVYDHYDSDGHGTPMAGICLFGDLFHALTTSNKILLSHFLESVKILPPVESNPEELIGYIHNTAASIPMVSEPNRDRVYCLTVTRPITSINKGYPSSTSSAMDNLCYGLDDDIKKLFCISAGNSKLKIDFSKAKEYPSSIDLELIEDPAQSWNAITVGAYTEKESGRSLSIIAKKGEISPHSSSSVSWTNSKQLPIKPEIVLEGGNLSFPDNSDIGESIVMDDTPDNLQILSVGKSEFTSPFTTVTGTSPAAALAANYCAVIKSKYNFLWEESIRGLLIHSANWTDAMKAQFLNGKDLRKCSTREKELFLRRVGYGVPDLSKCLGCINNSVTILAQEEMNPYQLSEKSNKPIFNDIHFFELPFPKNILEDLTQTNATLTITLSYYIEANPKTKSKSPKYTYASHGLRFATKKPLESKDEFKKRINRYLQENEEGGEEKNDRSGDLEGWTLRPDLQKMGSIHKDIWNGSCAELASKNVFAVFPTAGWWKYRDHLKKYGEKIRYSLIVSLETESIETDIYTPVMNELELSQEIPVSFI